MSERKVREWWVHEESNAIVRDEIANTDYVQNPLNRWVKVTEAHVVHELLEENTQLLLEIEQRKQAYDALLAHAEKLAEALEAIRWSWGNDAGRQCDNIAHEALAEYHAFREGKHD